ncbi:hypothetical protein [Erwinia sp.]|uniref:hypothetical protein n=1 Tax=Erwinia citreus TaxID=558 RepID=UPI003C78E32C
MQSVRGFKKRYFLVPLVVLLAGGIYLLSQLTPFSERVLKKVQINNLAVLYVTEGDAGATTAYSYRYFVYDASKSEKEFTESIGGDTQPFMITSDKDAEAKVDDGKLYLNVRGKIYSYSSSVSYKLSSGVYSVPVYLNAAPY